MPTDAEKARVIYTWMVNNISYDHTYKVYHTQDVFKKRKGICEGYSRLYQYMCELAGLQCIKIHGFAVHYKININSYYKEYNNTNHAWNIVTINGKKCIVDVTWGRYNQDPKEAIIDHFPKNPTPQLLEYPINFPTFKSNWQSRPIQIYSIGLHQFIYWGKRTYHSLYPLYNHV